MMRLAAERITARGARALLAGLTLALSACGGDESGTTPDSCGQVNATRACVGPGSCPGGQTCQADGTWSVCDCGSGGSGGSSGASGSSGAGASGGASGTAGASGSAGAGGSAGAPAGCPGTGGPKMINIGSFCIDETEVTQAQYAEFLAAKGGDTSGQSPQNPSCSSNTYEPTTGTVDCNAYPFDPVGKANYPVVCVDLCDALAFCDWAGKRLCGAVDGTDLLESELYDPQRNAWLHACTQGGQTKYAYGDDPQPACATAMPTVQPVKSMPDCHGQSSPFDGVYDLTGNVEEFIATCVDVGCTQRTFPLIGGHIYAGNSGAQCTYNGFLSDWTVHGIRCCASPTP